MIPIGIIVPAFPVIHMEANAYEELRRMLSDLLWLNALIATELIQVTENTSAILREGRIPISCLEEHAALKQIALEIAEKYRCEGVLRQHLKGHQ